jgi:hypothetical protein
LHFDAHPVPSRLVPRRPALPAAAHELTVAEDAWAFFADFARAASKAEAELWVNYRAHLYDLDDMVNLFSKKMRARAQALAQAPPADREAAGTGWGSWSSNWCL